MTVTNTPMSQHVTSLHRDLERVLRFAGASTNIDFYISSLTEHNPFNTTEEVTQWLRAMNEDEYFSVETTPLGDLRKWSFDSWTGDLEHDSGGFFSIRGLHVKTNNGPVMEWSQPIIDQPEIGVLGIITKKFDGILYFLIQAKAEPGNINTFQLSPTVQATQSNYKRLHGGKPTRYLEYFLDEGRAHVLIDQLQSEQGARFYHKRNRNIVVRVPDDEEIDLGPNFRWVTLGQLKRLVLIDNTVNMDTRSVISSISHDPECKTSLEPVSAGELRDCLENSQLVTESLSDFAIKTMISSHGNTRSLHSIPELMRTIAQHKFNCQLRSRLIPLNEIEGWRRTPNEIHQEEGKYFSVIGVRVSAANREVHSWDQPIVRQVDSGIIGFVAREIDGVLHLLVQLKMESGNLDLLEMAPTVQCITGNYQHENRPPFVTEMLEPPRGNVLFDVMQSEEGGRFYREENRNMLLLSDEHLPMEEPPRYLWTSINQIKQFLQFSNFLNVEARSLLAVI